MSGWSVFPPSGLQLRCLAQCFCVEGRDAGRTCFYLRPGASAPPQPPPPPPPQQQQQQRQSVQQRWQRLPHNNNLCPNGWAVPGLRRAEKGSTPRWTGPPAPPCDGAVKDSPVLVQRVLCYARRDIPIGTLVLVRLGSRSKLGDTVMGANMGKNSSLLDALPSTQGTLHVVMLGLDSAGKTTALYRLKFDQYLNTVPTIGFNCEKEKLRPLWKSYTRCTDGIVFVLDSVDVERMEEAKMELVRTAK
ncbi:ADP-ribosylation factor-like protein 4A [Frankliniella fusca]|uniref:ADP-ribosylation factor-like protein 4A n=1 Tax=Frankliniella fusca TaxID=407009 RepID=A0AAE1LS60_9NEOP|nr:ADP-ribosylation factor-like protein 4A [Frankliniella fusca]